MSFSNFEVNSDYEISRRELSFIKTLKNPKQDLFSNKLLGGFISRRKTKNEGIKRSRDVDVIKQGCNGSGKYV